MKLKESWSNVHRQLMGKETELQRERDLNLQLQDEKYHALTRYETERERMIALDRECEQLLETIQALKSKVKEQ